ncbi:MAG TPA: flagellar biosynthesis protein FlhB [Steroidobacteraceae bacterium]|nr:flagellar biosynthesis protein FlhB [Steroidobacteraceae bacterium]HQW08925.1 flagellar biosynthesis protein FlhB [Steroidobacteraceae bacterium]HQX48207.1 flagellar biosynthesis protein FlhB [Steroidobacteraceae bacterium]HQX77772.1 flagellar biosynthesis protein FlhB [Steroidobacteraceae bacterium]HQZ79690.1 flagellar biosynthesis protein FlhB [Steroidobacteraceae bacterium]
MSEHSAQERTERATPKRLEEARREGRVPRSQELTTSVVLLAAATALLFFGDGVGQSLAAAMREGLELTRAEALDDSQLVPALSTALYHAGLACLPVFGIVVLAVLAAPLTIGGWNVSGKPLVPDFQRLDPLAGFGRMFSMRGFVELAKALAKFALVAAVAALLLWRSAADLLALGGEATGTAIGHATQLVGTTLLALASVLLLIAAIDVPYQLWRHASELKMSREEVRQEAKESDGSPEVKGRIRQVQQAIARGRMLQDVPSADVIITNPTHYAVALRYDDKRARAPVVVAKGTELIAARIRAIAGEHGVAIVEAPPLARALYRSVDLGGEIPATLYAAVAQVLTHVYQLRAARRAGTQLPTAPTIH